MNKLKALCLCLSLMMAVLLADIPQAYAESSAEIGGVVINEIHYAPRLKSAHAEFIELYNPTPAAVDLSAWSLAQAVEYVFPPGASIPAGGYLVIAENPAAAAQLYGAAAIGPFVGRLASDGDEVVLRNASSHEIDVVDYGLGFPWPVGGSDADLSIGLINASLDNVLGGAWRSGTPTPGRPNSVLMHNPPPPALSVEHTPQAPTSRDAVTIQVKIAGPDEPASVKLLLQLVAPGNYIRLTDPAYASDWKALPMPSMGSNLYAVAVPAEYRRHRYLVRYRIEVTGGGDRKVTLPYMDDPQPNFAYYVYDGVPSWQGAINRSGNGPAATWLNFDFSQMRPLPVYQLIANATDIADSQFIPGSKLAAGYMGNDYPWRGTLVYNGVVYDHVGFRARGGEFRYALGKNPWRFDFNRGHPFQAYDNYGRPYKTRWGGMAFSSVMQHANRQLRGEQGLFESMSYRLFNLAGVAASNTQFVQFRVVDAAVESPPDQYAGDFWGLYLALEDMDGRFLDEHGLPDGNLYEMKNGYGELDHQGAGESADRSDLNAFLGTYTTSTPSTDWWRQQFDLNGYYSFRSVLEMVHHYDVDQGKNYAYYLNPETRRWSILPWDLDLTWAETLFGLGAEPFRDRLLVRPEFSLEYQNRLRELRDLLFNPDQLFPMLDEYAALIDTPVQGISMVDADRALWDYNPILDSDYVIPRRAVQGRYYALAQAHDFQGMVQIMRDYVLRRTAWIDQTLLTDKGHPNTPSLAYTGPAGYPADQLAFQPSGYGSPIGAGFAAIQWRAAQVVRPGLPGYAPGTPNRYEIEATWVSPDLTTFTPATRIPNGVCQPGLVCRVRVRMEDATGRWSHWSLPVEFVAGAPAQTTTRDLRLTEIMYHPAGATSATGAPGDELEFVELKNTGAAVFDLSNMRFTGGIEYTFPARTSLEPGQHLVLANNARFFRLRYGLTPFGAFDEHLNDQGEQILLLDAFGTSVLSVTYADGDGWPTTADGVGYSLVPANPLGMDDPNAPASWRASTATGGSPDADDPVPVVVNEVQIDPATTTYLAVELHNPATVDADVSGWILSDSDAGMPVNRSADLGGARLPKGTVIPAGGYSVITVDQLSRPLSMKEGIGWLVLFSAAPGGPLSGYRHGLAVEPPVAGNTLGRQVASDGTEYFVAQRAPSLGGANVGPVIGPVVISRLMVRPADGFEWLELTNITDQPVPLYDPSDPRRTWFVGGVFLQFPSGLVIAPYGRLLVAGKEPSEVCLSGEAPADRRVVGPFPIALADGGMTVSLRRPIVWGGLWQYAPVDTVSYLAAAPWPATPANGSMLMRLAPDLYGNDPAHWRTGLDDLAEPVSPSSPDQIRLCSFDAFVNQDGQMEVRWVTAPELSSHAYRLWRSTTGERATAELVLTQQAAVNAAGSSAVLHAWVDQAAQPSDSLFYWLEVVDENGSAYDLAFTTPRAKVNFVYVPLATR